MIGLDSSHERCSLALEVPDVLDLLAARRRPLAPTDIALRGVISCEALHLATLMEGSK